MINGSLFNRTVTFVDVCLFVMSSLNSTQSPLLVGHVRTWVLSWCLSVKGENDSWVSRKEAELHTPKKKANQSIFLLREADGRMIVGNRKKEGEKRSKEKKGKRILFVKLALNRSPPRISITIQRRTYFKVSKQYAKAEQVRIACELDDQVARKMLR